MSSPQARVRAYHERSKHQLQRYAAGPDTLDWDAQPTPYRRWDGAPMRHLPLVADTLGATWAEVSGGRLAEAHALSLRAVAAFFELSFGLTAWKQQGPDRWAVRATPSSGNLHPTEAYLLAQGVPGLADGLHHYAPFEHALVCRHEVAPGKGVAPAPGLWVGLSAIHWREAWKYGERAFRYCQLDTGHALGAVRYAAAVLGWQAEVVPGLGHAEMAGLMGLDRDADFGLAEREEPELLIRVGPGLDALALADGTMPAWAGASANGEWRGQASRLDRHPMYRWPVIDEVAEATRELVPPKPDAGRAQASASTPSGAHGEPVRASWPAARLIRERRSAQQFDRRESMPAAVFFRMMAALMPEAGLPFDAWPSTPRVHAILFAHRVTGLEPGAYVLPRTAEGATVLAASLRNELPLAPVAEAPSGLPLQRLVANPALAGTLRTLSCHQAIASDACFAVSLMAEFDAPIEAGAAQYRALYQEAGLLGQVLYMQAEAEGFRGTGIGCYFDDAVHELLGLQGQGLQALYHFTVGVPVLDSRIGTEPPYAGRPVVSELSA
jgi:SagB-type dehydrogenase family enzyme